MTTLHLIEGPVGSGKSTFAAELSLKTGAPRLILDDWFSTLYSPDRPETEVLAWYGERKERCIEQMWKLACEIAASGSDVILELGLILASDRQSFFSRVESVGHWLKIYVLDAPREIRRERVSRRNEDKGETYQMDVPEAFFELASDMWEPIDEAEVAGFETEFIDTAAEDD